MQTLGEAGVPATDELYAGETGESVFSLQYYRNKAKEFQSIMDELDATARSIRTILSLPVDENTADELQMWLAEFDSKKMLFRATAETINAGAFLINKAGGRFPVMQTPQSLKALPLAIPLAAVAALATAATLISWGRDWMEGVNRRLHDQRMLDAITDPEQRAEAARAVMDANAANERAKDSPLSSIANIVKWGAFAGIAYFGWKMWQNR